MGELIEWPEDEAEAAAITAQCRRIGDEYRALLAAGHDPERWYNAKIRILTAVIEYMKVREPEEIIDGQPVYTDHFRRFAIGLARGPGDGMTLAELASVICVPAPILGGWLNAEATQAT